MDYTKYGCINIHGSILPKYRGAAPIQRCVLDGEEYAGVTSMQMDVGLDTGDMLLVEKTKIGENETAGELFDRLAPMGAELLIKTLAALEKGEFYSSCGPEIYDFYVDEDKVILECSPVSRARLHSDMHPNQVRVDENGNITRAEFTLNHWAGPYDYVRASIVDKDGKQAWTNPIFLDGREG